MSRIPSPLRPALVTLVIAAAAAAIAAGDPPAGAKGPPREEAPPARTTGSGPAASKGEDKTPKLVCEQVEQMGSHFRRKVCATPEAWEARRLRDAAQMERMGDQGAGCGGAANPC